MFDLSILVAVQLLILHRLDGGEVAINPAAITSIHSALVPGRNVVVNEKAYCVIGLNDGKYVSVRETCLVVRQMLENLHK